MASPVPWLRDSGKAISHRWYCGGNRKSREGLASHFPRLRSGINDLPDEDD